jgi:hypothetical protein
VTCVTVKGGVTRGGMILQGADIKIVGYHCTGAPTAALVVYGADGCELYDSAQSGNGGGFGSTPVKVNSSGGDPRGLIRTVRFSVVPPVDIDGKPRVAADAGAFVL